MEIGPGQIRTYASMASLPDELLDLILSHLLADDLRSLRLSARRFLPAATALLFRTIYISPLHRDRDTFLRIAATTHLASVIRHVVWYEFSQGPASMSIFLGDHADEPGSPFFERCDGDPAGVIRCKYVLHDDDDFVTRMFHDALGLFWWNVPHPVFLSSHAICGTQVEFEAAATEFYPLFLEALGSMESLVGMTSVPMPPCRDMRTRGSEAYPFTPQLFQSSIHMRPEDRNLGLKRFLLPAMANLARLGTDPIVQKLQFADEGIETCLLTLGMGLGLKPVGEGLEQLTHLDLCLSLTNPLDNAEYEMVLLRLLTLTRNLTHLTLCFERSRCFDRGLCTLLHFPKLISVDLTDYVLPTNQFVAFIRKHAKTLREIRLEGYFLTPNVLRRLAAIPDLHLKRFVVLPHKEYDEWHDSYGDVEGRILDFVNSGGGGAVTDDSLFRDFTASIQTRAPGYGAGDAVESSVSDETLDAVGEDDVLRPGMSARENNAIQTHPAIFNVAGCTSAAICDSRGQFGSRYYAQDLRDLDDEAGDIRLYRNTAIEETCADPDVEMNDCHAMAADVDLISGLSFDTDLIEGTAAKKCDFKIEGTNNRISNNHSFDAAEADLEGDDRMRYVEEQLAYLANHVASSGVDSPPRWLFARSPDGDFTPPRTFYYRRAVVGDPPACLTETWYFKHRSGQDAWGNEPLDYWDDWEGKAAGDETEATPYGIALKKFIRNAAPGDGWETMWARGSHPEQYDAELDPFVVQYDEDGFMCLTANRKREQDLWDRLMDEREVDNWGVDDGGDL
ncbi:hypothetical protein ACHAQH_008064 [Verticillium albo-atrum]